MRRVICQEAGALRDWLSEPRLRCTFIALGLVLLWSLRLRGSDWVAPAALALSADGPTLQVAGARGRQVLTLDLSTAQLIRGVPLEEEATGLALSADGKQLAVTCSGQTNEVLLLDATTGQIRLRLAAGAGVCSPVFNPAGNTLYICLRFENAVAAIDLAIGRERVRIQTGREPIAAALSPDERLLVVANHLPDGPANRRVVTTAVTVLDTSSFTVRTNLALPNGSVGLRGIAVSPSGRFAAVTHNVARFQVPTTQVEHGWMNDSALSLIDLEKLTLKNTLLLDDPTRGAANPWAVAWSQDGRWLCVTHSGTHEVSVIDVEVLFAKLADATPGRLIDNLTFLEGVRKRVALTGNGPRTLVIQGTNAWVAGFFSDSVEEIELPSATRSRVIRLVETATANTQREGEQLFHDATIGHQSWQSCASCHPDGRADGLNWDLLNDGIGNPKNTKSLFLAHRTPPAMSHGVRGTAESAVRSGLRNILFALRPEAEAAAIDEYLKSLRPVPSPYLVGGELSDSARRGRRVFEDPAVGCATCHPGPLFTDLKPYAVGTANHQDRPGQKFDTPTLVECWRTAPYLHDGSAATIREVLTARNLDDHHGRTTHLAPAQVSDLAAYVLSL